MSTFQKSECSIMSNKGSTLFSEFQFLSFFQIALFSMFFYVTFLEASKKNYCNNMHTLNTCLSSQKSSKSYKMQGKFLRILSIYFPLEILPKLFHMLSFRYFFPPPSGIEFHNQTITIAILLLSQGLGCKYPKLTTF